MIFRNIFSFICEAFTYDFQLQVFTSTQTLYLDTPTINNMCLKIKIESIVTKNHL